MEWGWGGVGDINAHLERQVNKQDHMWSLKCDRRRSIKQNRIVLILVSVQASQLEIKLN